MGQNTANSLSRSEPKREPQSFDNKTVLELTYKGAF